MATRAHPKSPLKYFLLVYGLSAPFWIAQVFIKNNNLPLNIPITDIFAAFMPLLAACLLVRAEGGNKAVRDLLKRVFDFRRIASKRWLVVACLLPMLIFLMIFAWLRIANVPLPDHWQVSLAAIPLLLGFFFLGAVGEEVGYMGYAFGPTQKKLGALGAALAIGLPWAIWHYPSILEQGHDAVWILWGTLGTVAFRVILVWVYNNANASLFACIVTHAFYNTGRVLFPQGSGTSPLVDNPAIHYTVIAIVALVIALLWDSRTLTKFRLRKHA